jgi:phosphatidylglycerol:prolipoprotein diacylglycerol transferase
MFPTLQIGPLALQVPGLVILIAIWAGLSLSEHHAGKFGIKSSDLYNLAILMLAAGIIGARLMYIVHYPQAFLASPSSMISINPGLLDPVGGLAAGLLAGLIYIQRKGMPFCTSLDAITPALAVFGLGTAISHLASGAAFGAPTNLPWAINLWGAQRHPTQIYEIISAAAILLLIWPGIGPVKPNLPGIYFLSFIALSAGARLFLEAFRGDSQLTYLGLRDAQLVAWVILAISLAGIYWLGHRESVRET